MAKEYIKREAAIDALQNHYEVRNAVQNGIMDECVMLMMRVPAANVVPVVRCKDCKHRDPEDKKCDCGGLEHAHLFPVADDWFCADGERKDGDGDA